jgi:hypothetical protein
MVDGARRSRTSWNQRAGRVRRLPDPVRAAEPQSDREVVERRGRGGPPREDARLRWMSLSLQAAVHRLAALGPSRCSESVHALELGADSSETELLKTLRQQEPARARGAVAPGVLPRPRIDARVARGARARRLPPAADLVDPWGRPYAYASTAPRTRSPAGARRVNGRLVIRHPSARRSGWCSKGGTRASARPSLTAPDGVLKSRRSPKRGLRPLEARERP